VRATLGAVRATLGAVREGPASNVGAAGSR
jgi:hypothetical protein